MKRFALALAVGLTVLVAAPTNAGQDPTKPLAASVMKGSLATLVAAPPRDTARQRLYHCFHQRCRFRVLGTADCRGIIRTQERGDGATYVWVSRMACHTRR